MAFGAAEVAHSDGVATATDVPGEVGTRPKGDRDPRCARWLPFQIFVNRPMQLLIQMMHRLSSFLRIHFLSHFVVRHAVWRVESATFDGKLYDIFHAALL